MSNNKYNIIHFLKHNNLGQKKHALNTPHITPTQTHVSRKQLYTPE